VSRAKDPGFAATLVGTGQSLARFRSSAWFWPLASWWMMPSWWSKVCNGISTKVKLLRTQLERPWTSSLGRSLVSPWFYPRSFSRLPLFQESPPGFGRLTQASPWGLHIAIYLTVGRN
jgi:hypothetical protein